MNLLYDDINLIRTLEELSKYDINLLYDQFITNPMLNIHIKKHLKEE
jgi:hypothetical protein